MIDPSITGRVGLASRPFEEYEEYEAKWRDEEDEAGCKVEIVEEERRVEKKKGRVKADP